MAHGTHPGPITDQMVQDWIARLDANAHFDAPWVAAAIEWLLTDSDPDVVVDVGCGAGGAAREFARRLPAEAKIVAVDPQPELLAIAERISREEGLAGRIDWVEGEVDIEPVAPGSAALVWASGVLHHVADQQGAVTAIADLLSPGGRVALVEGGLPLRCLPHELGIGTPGLEARLEEARSRWFVDMRNELPGAPMPYGWPEALRRAGLTNVAVRSFLAEATPPLDDAGRGIVEHHLAAARDQLGGRLSAGDRETLDRLLDPDDVVFIGRRDDLVVSAVRTVNVATKPD